MYVCVGVPPVGVNTPLPHRVCVKRTSVSICTSAHMRNAHKCTRTHIFTREHIHSSPASWWTAESTLRFPAKCHACALERNALSSKYVLYYCCSTSNADLPELPLSVSFAQLTSTSPLQSNTSPCFSLTCGPPGHSLALIADYMEESFVWLCMRVCKQHSHINVSHPFLLLYSFSAPMLLLLRPDSAFCLRETKL